MSLEDPTSGKILPFRKPENQASPEDDPIFQSILFRNYKFRLYEKQFGKGFYEEYVRFDLRNQDFHGDDLVSQPDISAFREEVDELETIDEVLAFAENRNYPFTSKEKQSVQKETLEDYKAHKEY